MAEVFVVDALARAASEELRKLSIEWSTTTASRSWHLTQLGAQSVLRAQDHLTRGGFQSYYPKAIISRVLGKSKITSSQRCNSAAFKQQRKEPLFRNYMFVRVDVAQDHWHDTFRDAGIYGIACAGDQPYRIPDELIENIKAREVDGYIPGATRLADLLSIGDRVLITSGPFAHFQGTIEHIDGKDLATVLVDIFGRQSAAKLEFCSFEKL